MTGTGTPGRDPWLPRAAPGADPPEWEAEAYRWRPHSMISARTEAVDAAGAPFLLRTLWRRDDRAAMADAKALWAALQVLPPEVDADARAAELVSAAYRDGALRGVATASIARITHLLGDFAFVRVLVVPEERRAHLSGVLISHARAILDRWSAANPDAGLLGIALLIEAAELDARARIARWENSGTIFAGYLGRTQLRVGFFDHATVAGPPEG
jgi:hypothetical protein